MPPHHHATPTRLPLRWSDELRRAHPADLHDAWLLAAADATLACAAWNGVRHEYKASAHAAYVAALDREAHAAHVLEQRLRR